MNFDVKKDVYIAVGQKEKIVDFLSKKTGMEWYMFRHSGEITKAVKPYLMEMVKGFDEAKISFNSHEEYIDTCECCIQRYGKKVRLTFSFSEEEFALMKETAERNHFINMVDFIITALYALIMQGKTYETFNFLTILRSTKNGGSSRSIISEVSSAIENAYQTLLYELGLVKTGGAKKGFLTATKKLGKEEIKALKDAWNKYYGNNSEDNVIILNDGLDFKEGSNSSVELQINERNK